MATLSHFEIPDADIEVIEYKRDEKIDEAKASVLSFLRENSGNVFYERQLTIIFEDRYFHWISVKALLELVAEGSILSEILELAPKVPIRFFRMKANRYWKRQASQIIKLVRRFSAPDFARAIGLQGELLVDAALPLAGFNVIARNVNSFQDRLWTKTGHDLDRIVERQGSSYGVEIKNTLPYIERDEFRTKLEMCSFLGLRPLFVCRMAPKSYSFDIIQQGGISWILGTQYYPFGHDELADTVQRQLHLPVVSRARIQDGDVARLLKATQWVLRHRPTP
jgi:predicted RecB family endonuclease